MSSLAGSTPETTPDAVVVGGGIVGVCTALQLQRSGRTVRLIERGGAGHEASGHNGGVFSGDCLPTGLPSVIRSLPRMLRDPMSPLAIRWRYLPQLSPWLIRFARNSRASQVERIAGALGSLTTRGVDAYRPLVADTEAAEILSHRGFLNGYRTSESFEKALYSRQLRSRHGVHYDVLNADAIGRHDPILAGRLSHAVYFTNAFFTTDPRAFTETLTDLFVAAGGQLQRAEVTGFKVSQGQVDAVVTTDGTVFTGTVVIAAGPWSRRLLRRLGSDVPLDVERGYGVDISDPGITVNCPTVLSDFHVCLSPHRSGLRLTGIDELAGLNAAPNFTLVNRVVKAAKIVFPELRTDNATPWMRRRPSMPDSLPVIGRAPKQRNVYLAFGHGHKGLGMGAITGQLVRELMDDLPPSVDVAPFSPTRFSVRPGRDRTRLNHA